MNDIDAAWQRAEDLAEVGRYADAETIVRTTLGQAPDNAELLTMLGYLLRLQQRYLDALAACDAAVAVAPDRGDAHAQRAWILIGIHRTAEAVRAATEAVRLDPHQADRHLALAQALSDDDRLDDARETAREALRLVPRSASALLTLADIERLAGNRDTAGAVTRQALAIDPTSTRGRRMLAMLDADRAIVRRSMRMLAEIAHDRPVDPDLMALLWPIRRAVVAPRWWLPAAAALVAAAGLVTAVLGLPAAVARVAAVLTCTVTVGFVLRTLVPAGRLPWQYADRMSKGIQEGWLSRRQAASDITDFAGDTFRPARASQSLQLTTTRRWVLVDLIDTVTRWLTRAGPVRPHRAVHVCRRSAGAAVARRVRPVVSPARAGPAFR